ncbi:MAG: tyrosine-type recombinase/integrase [Rhizobiaceae bacterium]|nr:MAG: tyrosine-type recombinase/integrase [Rhizobiaceae bacterium]
MTAIAPLITSYLREHLPVEKGASANTCDAYAYTFRLLFEFASRRSGARPSQIHLEQIDMPMVVAFLDHIQDGRGNAASTRNARLAAIRSFMRFVEYRVPSALAQVRQIHAIPSKRHETPLIKHLRIDEIRAILNTPDLSSRMGVRDRAMLHLCFAGALRVSELVSLPVANVSLQAAPSIWVRGKGRKERCLPLWKETAKDLRAWMAIRGDPPAPELFVSATGRAMTRAGFEFVLGKHVAQAAAVCSSLKGRHVSPHQLRHSCALYLLQATRDVRKVSLWLGHADVRTTEVYLRVDPSEKLEALEAAVPPALRRGKFKPPDALIASLFDEPPRR